MREVALRTRVWDNTRPLTVELMVVVVWKVVLFAAEIVWKPEAVELAVASDAVDAPVMTPPFDVAVPVVVASVVPVAEAVLPVAVPDVVL